MKKFNNKKKATVRAFENNHVYSDEIKTGLIEQGVKDPKLLKDLSYLMEFEPNKALLEEGLNGESIIYVAEPEQSVGEDEFEELFCCIYSCLYIARANGFRTIEFPPLGVKKCHNQQIMAEAFFDALNNFMVYGFAKYFDTIILNIDDEKNLSIFEKALKHNSIIKGGVLYGN